MAERTPPLWAVHDAEAGTVLWESDLDSSWIEGAAVPVHDRIFVATRGDEVVALAREQ